MAEDQGEKTEEPTEHKLAEARKKGQVFKSKELIGALEFAAIAFIISVTGAFSVHTIYLFAYHTYTSIGHLSFTPSDAWRLQLDSLGVLAKIVLPILGVAFIAAFFLNAFQTGINFSTESLNPSLEKLSPLKGFQRIFSRKSLVELGKQIFKITVIGWVAYKLIRNAITIIIGSVDWSLRASMLYAKKLMFDMIWDVTAAYMVLAIIDYVVQKKMFMMEMRMSMQEVKDEFKDTEGDPHLKSKIKQMQRQLVEKSMGKEIPKASAVITNPTHLAVALKYERGQMDAPLVVAKGERLVAQRIKELAEENDVPILENVGLARALFESCKVGQMIPGDLYKAVAEILAFVYKLKKKKELAKKRAILRVREKLSKARGRVQRGSK